MLNPCTEGSASGLTRRLGLAGLACVGFALWVLSHPYRGLEHDSVLYAVLALARLHPAALAHDLFVRYGAQDHFTIFSPLFATAIQGLGLEPAAAIMTFATHFALFGAAWLLARRLMPAAMALLAVGLLAVLPSWYGSGSVFAYIEGFLTPRQSAEALVLAGLAAALYSRRAAAVACLGVAFGLHPTIAAAGITMCLILFNGWRHPRATAILIGALGAGLVAAAATGLGPFRHFDASWWKILQTRLAYLFPLRWTPAEWLAMGIRAAVLVVGMSFSRSETVRRICAATLLTVVLGMLFAILESDWLQVIIAAQMQTWRWLWLAGVMSVLLSPAIAADCWHRRGLGRAAAVLLLSAWLTRSDTFAAVPMLLACLTALVPRGLSDPRQARLVEWGAYVLLAGSLLMFVGEVRGNLPQLGVIGAGHRHYMAHIAQAQALANGGLLPAALLVLAWWWARAGTRGGAIALAALGVALVICVLPYGVRTWTHARYPEERTAAFAPWRAAIPQSAEILWPDPPPAAWFELGRASYWSLYQMAGMVFSRDVTMVSTSRETAVRPVLPQLGRKLSGDKHYALATPTGPAGRSRTAACALPGVTFFASWLDLGPTPYPPVVPDVDNPRQPLYLYRCDDVRH